MVLSLPDHACPHTLHFLEGAIAFIFLLPHLGHLSLRGIFTPLKTQGSNNKSVSQRNKFLFYNVRMHAHAKTFFVDVFWG